MLTSREATEVPRLGSGYPFIAANIKRKLRSRSPQNAQHFTSYCTSQSYLGALNIPDIYNTVEAEEVRQGRVIAL